MSITGFCLVDKVRIFLQNYKQANNKNAKLGDEYQ